MSKKYSYLILAGGFATRLWPLSEHRAKPLLLVDGQTILAHQLKKIPLEAEIILLTNQKFAADFQLELVKLGRIKQTKIFLEDSYADGEKLGALGAIAAAIKTYEIDQNIIVFAGDNLLPNLQIQDLFGDENESVIAVRKVETLAMARNFGVIELDRITQDDFRLDDKSETQKVRVCSFIEKPHQPVSKLVSTGFMSFGAKLLPFLTEYAAISPDALGGIFPYLLQKKATVLATEVRGDWYDIGSFDQYLSAHESLQTNPIITAENVTESGNTFSGKIFIGDGCLIKNCILHDVIVYPHTKLENCMISKSVIDTHCHLSGIDLNQKLIRSGTEFLR